LIGKYLGLAREFTPDLDANQESIGDAPIENAEHSISKQVTNPALKGTGLA
jgi:hypothetical protein